MFESEYRQIEPEHSTQISSKVVGVRLALKDGIRVSSEYSEPFDLIRALKSESVVTKSAEKPTQDDDSAYSSCCVTYSTSSTPKIIEKISGKVKSNDYQEQEQQEEAPTTFDSSLVLSSSSASSSSPTSPFSKPPRLAPDYESVQDTLMRRNKTTGKKQTTEEENSNNIGDLFKSTITAFDILSERCSELIDLFDGKTSLMRNTLSMKRRNFTYQKNVNLFLSSPLILHEGKKIILFRITLKTKTDHFSLELIKKTEVCQL